MELYTVMERKHWQFLSRKLVHVLLLWKVKQIKTVLRWFIGLLAKQATTQEVAVSAVIILSLLSVVVISLANLTTLFWQLAGLVSVFMSAYRTYSLALLNFSYTWGTVQSLANGTNKSSNQDLNFVLYNNIVKLAKQFVKH